jgi:hypothetical protein
VDDVIEFDSSPWKFEVGNQTFMSQPPAVHEKNRLGIPPPTRHGPWAYIWLCVARVLALGFSESYNNNNCTSDLSCLHHRLPNLEALHSLFRIIRNLTICTLFTAKVHDS